MYVKVKNNEAIQYPYSLEQLKMDNKNVSFPKNPSDNILAEFGVYRVVDSTLPEYTYKQYLVEKTPKLLDNQWVKDWKVIDKDIEDVNAIHEEMRIEAYRNESDPLFFKWQRNEATEQEWLDKVAEIKARYPK